MPLTDPSITNPPKRVNPRVLLLYGREKIGKSSLAAQVPDSYMCVLQYEGCGADYMSYRGHTFTSLKEFTDALPQLKKWNEEKKFKRLVIDTLDALVSWFEDECTVKYGKTIEKEKDGIVASVFELKFGRGNTMATARLKDVWSTLLTVCDEIVFLAHTKFKDFDKAQTVQQVVSKEIDLPGGMMRNMVCHQCCAAAFVWRDGNTVKASFKCQDDAGGSRAGHLNNKTITLSEKQEDGSLKTFWDQVYLPEPAQAKAETKQAEQKA